MTDTNNDSSPVALAEPPEPPSGPPKAPAATGEAPEPKRNRVGVVALVSVVVLAVVLLGAAIWLVLGQVQTKPAANKATQPNFESAMRKAGVKATYPGGAIDLKAVRPTGSHSFTATFTADEIAALLNTFRYTSDVGGTQIALRNVQLQFTGPDVVQASAAVRANGSTYNGAVTLNLYFEMGRFKTTGASDVTVEGIGVSSDQRGLVADSLVNFANDYLSSSLGLTVVSAKVDAGGVAVSGMAPDSITYAK